MIGWTLFSGIGAPEVAAPWVDWRLACEIEPFPRRVLKQRLGYKPPEDRLPGEPVLVGDVRDLLDTLPGVPLPDVIVAGSPCQAFSVAGLRGGLDDDRGNLTLVFVEVVHAIQREKQRRGERGLTVVWENVPGVLSDKTNAFGAFLGGMVGAVDALQSPEGRRWPSEGMVQGPRARAAWAVLDAQWFGVAQRRRRVFAVFDFGGGADPAAVLLESDGVRGDNPPRREAWQAPSHTLGACTGGGGGLGTDFEVGGGLVSEHPCSGTVSSKWHKGAGGPAGDELYNLVGFLRDDGVAHTLKADGCDASEDGSGRGNPLVAFDPIGTEVVHSDDGTTHTLRSMAGAGRPNAAVAHAVCFRKNQRSDVSLCGGDGLATGALGGVGGKPGQGYQAVACEPWVRRLTPRECERLQGFPDDWTLVRMDKRRPLKDVEAELAYLRHAYPGMSEQECRYLAPDTPRYKAIGNAMAVPVVRWIMDGVKLSWKGSSNE